MENEIKDPIHQLAYLLGCMTVRATEAERQRDEAQKSSDEWYQNWQRKDAQFKAVEDALKREAEEHEKTRAKLNVVEKYIEQLKKEADENE